jgi:HK97 family phage major capsid protein
MTPDEIRDARPVDLELRMEVLRDEMLPLDKHEKPTSAQVERLNALCDEFDACQRALKMHKLRAAASNPANRMSGSAPDSYEHDYGRVRGSDPWEAVRTAGPFGLGEGEVRSRALGAVEIANVSDAVRERATVLLENCDDVSLAEWVLPASDPAYRSAFRKIVRDPLHGHLEFDAQELAAFRAAKAWQRMSFRAMSEGTNAAGLFLVPFSLDPSIQLTNTGTLGDTVRDLCRVDVRATNVHHVITSAGVTAEWKAEASAAADASPNDITQPSITLHAADAYLQASFELLSDTAFEAEIGGLISDAKARLEAAAHINGTGSGQPTGVVTALAGVTASRVSATTNGALGTVDIFNLIGDLPARYHRQAAWLAHPNIGYKIRQLATGSGQQAGSFWVDLGPDNGSSLVGRSWNEASEMVSSLSAATASNDDLLIVADFKSLYRIVDHPGAQMIYEPLVKDASTGRPSGEAGWFVWWRSGGEVINSDAGRILRV